ncbi:MAG: hypothetical protein JW984_13350 [Deltaproteobacteria bacterium]|uniref:Uncharacterized protein n=1 Tax=Candidatus Zymogenus saltonus TaxID=2844893 RepID=A0A9D8KGI0_9DELT|nr:hypothetical protein [Candidatus Zymogenus saltonus]
MVDVNTEYIKKVIPKFKKFIETEGKIWEEERTYNNKFFKKYFSKEGLLKLDEGTLREMIHKLWAFNSWTNKDYLLQEMLKSDIQKIRDSFGYLLFSNEPIEKRFDLIIKNVRMMGAAAVSEILTHSDSSKYPIYNRRSKEGLIALGVSEKELPKSAAISGKQYKLFCDLVNAVKDKIINEFKEFEDLFYLDFLLYYISMNVPDKKEGDVLVSEVSEDFDHDEVVDLVLKLGDGLGFDVDKEIKIAAGSRIDVIWKSRIANLGIIAYAFEVHRRGGRDSAILNLQKIVNRDPSIQKVIIVSNDTEIEKFRNEISSLSEGFRKSVEYLRVEDLQSAINNLESLQEILNSLGLLTNKKITS